MNRTRRAAWLVILLIFMLFSVPAAGEVVSVNPLLTPPVTGRYAKTDDDILNILLLGIDYGGETFGTSGGKKELEECHTDGVVVVSVNKTDDTINLVSIPRDSFTYVPGVKGIYKFNAAINCGDTLEEGFRLACDAASWHLGGIRIDKYIAVDAAALVALGDAIGGVDFDIDADFTGVHRKRYDAGMQHLDGVGIMDYMRVRKAHAKEKDDLGRTKRQRAMLTAIIEKIKANPSLVLDILKVYQSGKLNIFTDISIFDALTLAPMALSLDSCSISSYMLEGEYRSFGKNFTFNDQDVRKQIIQEVYGLDVEPMSYVSYPYTQWLNNKGLTIAKYINMSRAVLEHAKDIRGAAKTEEYKALDAAIDACVLAFDLAATDPANRSYTWAMTTAGNDLKPIVEAAAKAFDYPEPLRWYRSEEWYTEPLINECQLNWN